MKKKLKVILAGSAAVATIAVAGISYAAYARTSSAEATGTSEKFRAVTVVGEWGSTGGLLPGEAGDVRVKLGVSAENTVAAKVVKIFAQAITAADITGIPTANKEACAGKLSTVVYQPAALAIAPSAQNVVLTLKEAVKFDESATVDCEGMSFKTKWTVEFGPERNPVNPLGNGGTANVTAGSVAPPAGG